MTWVLPLMDNYRLALTLGGLALMVVIPLAQMALATLGGGVSGATRLFRDLSLILIPLVLALHLALSAQHLLAGSPGVLQGVAVELGLQSSGHLPPDSAYFVNVPLKVFQAILLTSGVAGMVYLDGRRKVGLHSWRGLLVRTTPGLVMTWIFLQPMSAVC